MSRNFDALKSPLQGFLGYYSRFVPPARWITFSGVPSTLTNFPVLVKANGWQNIANGYDVHFQDSSGNELSFDLDWYDDSSKTGTWWVRIPTLFSGTAIKVLYGDTSLTTDQSSPSTVWANYDYVYHFTDPDNIKSSVGSYVADPSYGNLDFSSITMISNTMTGRGMRFCATSGYGDSSARLKIADGINSVPQTFSAHMTNVSAIANDWIVNVYTGWTVFGFRLKGETFESYAGSQTNSIPAVKDGGFLYGTSTESGSVAWVQDCEIIDSSACASGQFRWDVPWFDVKGYNAENPTVFALDELRIGGVYRTADWLLYEQRNLAQHDSYTTYSEEV